jgi:hypothetical protein
MALDLDAIAARFKRAGAAPRPAPDTAAAPASEPAPVERPWLTAEAFMPPEPAPAAQEQGPAAPGPPNPPTPPRRTAGRGPKRRRWTLPGSPAERRAEPVDPPPAGPHRGPHCGRDHQPIRMGGGLAALAGRSVLPEPGQRRPPPLGREPGDTAALVRDSFRPWSTSPAAEPRPPTPLNFRERITALWYGDAADS